ncbi:hypothetical protein PG993_000303 [Apiospora rasikravindrae]|uniref:Uncharacterized protein n=1 Tax=Apiospora rasikravindrae TaxID=990691 RepID=A0ABR1U854_9PEZI
MDTALFSSTLWQSVSTSALIIKGHVPWSAPDDSLPATTLEPTDIDDLTAYHDGTVSEKEMGARDSSRYSRDRPREHHGTPTWDVNYNANLEIR